MHDPGRGFVHQLTGLIRVGLVLLRVLLIVGVAFAVFLAAFLGYFIIPFIFLLVALALLGMTSMLRAWARWQARARDRSRRR